MKLSLILAPLIAAKVPHEIIMDTILAFEAQQTDALEKRREADRNRQNRKRNGDVTLSHVTRSPSRSHARGEDSSSKKDITGKEESKEDTSPSARSKRGERIPEDFQPDIEAAISEGLSRQEAERQAKSFCDYWRAKPGKDGLKLDWPATWRVWFRRNAPKANAPPQQREPRNAGERALMKLQSGHHHEPPSPPDRHLDPGDGRRQIEGTGLARRFAGAQVTGP